MIQPLEVSVYLLLVIFINYDQLHSHVFTEVGDAYAYAWLHKFDSLWIDEFKMIELDEIMRQRDDSQFAQLLCRVRTASCTDEDIKVLESRIITDDHPGYPLDALHF